MRTWTQFCLLALVPLLLVNDRGFSDQEAGFAVVAFSAAGGARHHRRGGRGRPGRRAAHAGVDDALVDAR